jgi:Protein of unknown function (DUF2589)
MSNGALAVQTLGSVDFSQIIGGPLIAAVNASAASAQTTAQYIMTFVTNSNGANQLETVTFTYGAYINSISQTSSISSLVPVTASLTVPVICLLPIPYLQVENMTINFHAQIQQMNAVTNTNVFGTTTTFDSGTGGFLSFFESSQLQCTVADQNVNSAVSQQSSTFSLDVSVQAGVAPMPAGMAEVLNIFNKTIVQQQLGQ